MFQMVPLTTLMLFLMGGWNHIPSKGVEALSLHTEVTYPERLSLVKLPLQRKTVLLSSNRTSCKLCSSIFLVVSSSSCVFLLKSLQA